MLKRRFITLAALTGLVCASLGLQADPPPPAWWSDTGNGTAILNPSATPNNYGALNLGQLKYTVYQASNYLNQQLAPAGGAGSVINGIVANFTTNSTTNFAPATIGQLKYLAQPFYDRLTMLGYNTTANLIAFGYPSDWSSIYPWTAFPPGPTDTGYNATTYSAWQLQQNALANLGQLKMVFSFDVSGLSLVNDTPYGFYAWAAQFGLNISNTSLASLPSPAGDGLTNWQKYVADENPWDYAYSAAVAANLVLNVTSTNPSYGSANSTMPVTLQVTVNGSPLSNASILYTVLPSSGGGQLTDTAANISNSTSGNVFTDSNGTISMNYTLGNSTGQWVHFSAPSTNDYADAVFSLNGTGNGSSGGNSTPSPGIVGNLVVPSLDTGSTNADPFDLEVELTDLARSTAANLTNVVTLTWSVYNVEDDDTVSYLVEREEENTGNWTSVGTVSSSAHGSNGSDDLLDLSTNQFYIDDTLAPGYLYGGRRYIYRVTIMRDGVRGASTAATYTVPLFKSIDTMTVYTQGDLPVYTNYSNITDTNYYDFTEYEDGLGYGEEIPYLQSAPPFTFYRTETLNSNISGTFSDGNFSGNLYETYTYSANTSVPGCLTWDGDGSGYSNYTENHAGTDWAGYAYNSTASEYGTISGNYLGFFYDSWTDGNSTWSENGVIDGDPTDPYHYSGNYSWYLPPFDDYYLNAITSGSNMTGTKTDIPDPSWVFSGEGTLGNDTLISSANLTNPYTPDDFLTAMISTLPDFPDTSDPSNWFQNGGGEMQFGGEFAPDAYEGGHTAYYYINYALANDDGPAVVQNEKYQIEYNPSDNPPVSWKEDWIDDSGNMTTLNSVTGNFGGGNTSSVYTPTMPSNISLGDGYLALVFSPQPVVNDQYGQLDAFEASSENVTFTNGGGTTFSVPATAGVDHATISWTTGTGMSVDYSDGGSYSPLSNGETIGNDQSIDFDEYTSFAPVASSVSSANEAFEVTITYYNAQGNSLGTSEINFKYQPPTSLNVSADEVAGAEYRKIALNGRPLPDSKPQTASESDQQDEETFVDALTLGLRHNVTDVYEAIPGAETPLSVSRVYGEDIWADRHGLRPEERPDQPFGSGWTSNIMTSAREEDNYTAYEVNGDVLNNYFSLTGYPNLYISDENGNEYHFLKYYNEDGDIKFVPYPTGKHEKNPYEATLTWVAAAGETPAGLVLTKKFGTTVTYQEVPAFDAIYNDPSSGDAVPNDRLLGGSGYTGYSYYRAISVIGRGGIGNLTYAYAANDTLVPETIKGTGGNNTSSAGNLTISIEQDDHGHVTDVWDSDNNHTHYGYSYASDPAGAGNVTELTSVTDAMNVTSNYTYNITTESETTPALSSDSNTTFYHFNLTSIQDQNANTYTFNYQLSYPNGFNGTSNTTTGFESYYDGGGNSSLASYYNTPGRPLLVSNITPPIGNATTFYNDSFVELAPGNGTSGNTGIVLSGNTGDVSRRHSIVVDADGRRTDYAWSNGTVMLQDIPAAVAAESPNSEGEQAVWGNMTTTYMDSGNTLGTETYTFDKWAGMALASATDMSGQHTSYTHTDGWSVPDAYKDALPGVYDDSADGYYGNYDDPNTQTNALSQTKSFSYDKSARLMRDITDENGNLTHYQFDGGDANLTSSSPGLRTAEIHYNGSTTSDPRVAETDYTYGNTTFPGVVTKKVVQELDSGVPSDPGNLTVEYNLDAHGRVAQQVVDPDGLALTTNYTYSTGGDKLTETDPNNQTTYFHYDGRHRLTSVVYPDNTSRSYAYDGRGNPTSETDENGHTTLKGYDSLNRLTSETRVMSSTNAALNAGGNLTTSYTYSNTGMRLSMTDANGNTTHYYYDGLNRLTETETPAVLTNGNTSAGNLTTYYYYNGTNPGGNAFDSSSFKPTMTVDPRGYVTQVAYDDLYRPVAQSAQYVLGSNTTSALYVVTTKVYDNVGNLLTANVSANGSSTPGSLGGTVETTGYTYDALNRLTQTTYADGSNTTSNTTTSYTSTGLAWQTTDELGRATQKTYDGAGRVTVVTQPGSITTRTTYDGNGNARTVTNPLGQTWEYFYDARNRKVAEVQPAVEDWTAGGWGGGSFVTPTIRTTYDNAGNVLSVTDARGNTTNTLYDDANRPTYTFTPPVSYGSDEPGLLVTAKGYDANGNVLVVKQGTATGPSASDASLDGRAVLNTYDALNRLTSTTQQLGSSSNTSVDMTVDNTYDEAGNRVLVTDGLGTHFSYTYDGLNRVTEQSLRGGEDVESFTYNALNKTVESAGLGTMDLTYDLRNRLLTRTLAGASASNSAPGVGLATLPIGCNYTYDAAGNLLAVQQTMAYGNYSPNTNVAYAYDDLNRVVLEIQGPTISGTVSANGTNAPNGVSGGFVNQYAYDAAGNRVSAIYGVGRSDARTLTSEYDNLNRVKLINEQLASASGIQRQTFYHYDAAGNRVDLLQPNYGEINTTFDALGRQAEITNILPGNTGEAYNFTLAYDQFGNLRQQAETYPNGQLGDRTVNLGYDGADRLVSEAMVTGNTTVTSNYTYDQANDRTSKITTQQIGSNTATTLVDDVYSYDRTFLTEVQHYAGGNLTAYDLYGGPNSEFGAPGHGTVGEWEHYTISGNTAALQTSWSYSYDFDNRLVLALEKNAGASYQALGYQYAYDYRGRRVARESSNSPGYPGPLAYTWASAVFSGGTSVREYSGNSSASGEWSSFQAWWMPAWTVGNTTLSPSVEYVRGSDWGGGVGGVLYSLHGSGNATTANFYHYDGRGDVVAQTSGASGNVVYQAAYNAYGEHTPAGSGNVIPAAPGTQEWTASGAVTDDLRANTKEEDPTGLLYEGQRYRMIGTDFWMTPDPAGMVDGTNMYGYVKENPWTKYDPQGLSAYTDLGNESQSLSDNGHPVASFFVTLGQQAWELASGGTASKNGQIGDDIDSGKTSLGGGVAKMVGNGAVAAAGLVTGGEGELAEGAEAAEGAGSEVATATNGSAEAADDGANAVASANKGADTASTAAPEGTAAAPESAGTDAPATAGDTPAAAPEPPPEPVTDTQPAPTAEPSVGASDPVADAPVTPEPPEAAESGLPAKLYHYTQAENVPGILEGGLQPGKISNQVFTTPVGTYSPIEAQMYLGLKPNVGLPGSMLEIDTATLRSMGISPVGGPMRVLPTPNAMGGGSEIIFDRAIPPAAITPVR